MTNALGGVAAPRGGVTLHVTRAAGPLPRLRVTDDLARDLCGWEPKTALGRTVRACFGYLPSDLAAELLERIRSVAVIETALRAVHIHGRNSHAAGRRDDYGIVSRRVITDAGVNFIVDAFQNLVELEIQKYHGLGTGTTAESAAQTALVTELTTQYATDNTRPAGTQTEGAANVYVTAGTNTLDGTAAVTEHGIFSASSAGTLLDRSVFSAINLVSGDTLITTYSCTLASGG